MKGWRDKWVGKWIHGWMDYGWVRVRGRWMNGWMVGGWIMEGRMSGQMSRWMDDG